MKNKKVSICSSLLVIALFIFFISIYFIYNKPVDKYYKYTYINGIDVSGLTVKEANKKLTEKWNSNKVTISFKDNEEAIDLKDIDLKYNINKELKNIKDNLSYTEKLKYFFHLKNAYHVDMKSIESDKLSETIKQLKLCDNKDKKPTKNAYVDLSTKEFKVIPEETGTEIDPKSVEKYVVNNICKGNFNFKLIEVNIIKKPEITSDSDEIKEKLKYCKDNLSYDIEYDIDGEKIILTPEQLNSMVKYDKDKVDYNNKNIKKYVNKLAETYNQYYKTYNFKTSYGSTIQVQGVTYGRILDQDAEIEYLKKALKKKKSDKHTLNWAQNLYSNMENDGIGNSYVEVSISGQHVWCYKNGECVVSCDCVSGQPGHDTYRGVFTVEWVSGPMTLKGENDDGSKYESKVNCFMPFYGGQGLHGSNGWRSSWGGNIYRYNGSHGCVNCPDGAAWEMHNIVEAGYPVVIY